MEMRSSPPSAEKDRFLIQLGIYCLGYPRFFIAHLELIRIDVAEGFAVFVPYGCEVFSVGSVICSTAQT